MIDFWPIVIGSIRLWYILVGRIISSKVVQVVVVVPKCHEPDFSTVTSVGLQITVIFICV